MIQGTNLPNNIIVDKVIAAQHCFFQYDKCIYITSYMPSFRFLTCCSLSVLLAALTRGCRGFNELSYLFSNTTTTLMASTCSFTELWPLAKWLSVWRGNRIRLRVSTNKIRVPNLICNYTLHNYPNGKISTASNSCRSSKLDI